MLEFWNFLHFIFPFHIILFTFNVGLLEKEEDIDGDDDIPDDNDDDKPISKKDSTFYTSKEFLQSLQERLLIKLTEE